jgi:hypothetical protein
VNIRDMLKSQATPYKKQGGNGNAIAADAEPRLTSAGTPRVNTVATASVMGKRAHNTEDDDKGLSTQGDPTKQQES